MQAFHNGDWLSGLTVELESSSNVHCGIDFSGSNIGGSPGMENVIIQTNGIPAAASNPIGLHTANTTLLYLHNITIGGGSSFS